MTPEEFHDEFFRNYRGRYSSYWVERWGLIPSIPTSFDNANSIYELLAWLQRAFKQLLDDFVALESEFEDFKNALTELLENLVPLLIKRYMESAEADRWFTGKADKYYERVIKPYIDEQIRNLKEKVERDLQALETRINEKLEAEKQERIREINNLKEKLEQEKEARQRDKEDLTRQIQDQATKNNDLKDTLTKLISNLEKSGAWAGGLKGNFKEGRNLATGNINIFGGTPDGNSFIRTNNGSTENDLSGGI
jgi:orf15 protein|nr:MAG TPA: nucleoporin [Caudoviricetes sp.]